MQIVIKVVRIICADFGGNRRACRNRAKILNFLFFFVFFYRLSYNCSPYQKNNGDETIFELTTIARSIVIGSIVN